MHANEKKNKYLWNHTLHCFIACINCTIFVQIDTTQQTSVLTLASSMNWNSNLHMPSDIKVDNTHIDKSFPCSTTKMR